MVLPLWQDHNNCEQPTPGVGTVLTLHHLKYSQSFRIIWLLEELGADYELKIY